MEPKQPREYDWNLPSQSSWNNPTAWNKKSWAPGEFDTGNANPYSKWNTTKGAQGYYDTRRALMQAYGTKNVNDINNLITHANKVRREAPGAYNLAPVPDRVKRDESFLGLMKMDPVNAAEYANGGPMAYEGGNYQASKIKAWMGDGRRESSPAVIREGGGLRTVTPTMDVWSEIYNGLSNPATKHVASRIETPHSAISHEMTHAHNWPKYPEESSVFGDRLARTYNNNKAIFSPEMQYSSYNSEYPVEAYQNAAQMKRIAYNKFYQENGRFPSGEQELRKAYTDVANSDNPVSFEHVRFINEMTPAAYPLGNDQWAPQEELDRIRQININNWINQMLKRDVNGNFFQDALVRRGRTGVEKTAGAKTTRISCSLVWPVLL